MAKSKSQRQSKIPVKPSLDGGTGKFLAPSPLKPLPTAILRSQSPTAPRPRSAMSIPSVHSESGSSGTSSGENTGNKGNVKVVVRARPFLPREIKNGSKCVIKMSASDQSTTITHPSLLSDGRQSPSKPSVASGTRNLEPKKFYFDRSFDSIDPSNANCAGQQTVYEDIGREYLDHNFQGYNTCIFAYGQTGSGKTFTMMGTDSDLGIIPRTCQDLFARVEQLMANNVSCTVRISYFEVYNEQVRDLLVPAKKDKAGREQQRFLKVREAPETGPYVEGLSEYVVKDVHQVINYMQKGNSARVTAATKMNDQSSRSHAVFTMSLKQVLFHDDTDTTEEKCSQLRLVDLAGSERANATGATGARLREGSNINKSLSTLGRVIACLSSPAENRQVVPYRDSVLTWLLKESLGGNSKTAMVACVSPSDYEETLSTLRYADQAKRIKTRAIINQDIVSAADRDKIVEEMQEQIQTLQHSLNTFQQQEEDQFKQELGKIKQAIRFYEDRAITEEQKRKVIQADKLAADRHNKLLTEYLKEITNKAANSSPLDLEETYDSLKEEHDQIKVDIKEFTSSLSDMRARYLKIIV